MQTKNNKIGFDLNTLEMFARVVACHSFTQAAAELEITKSTISRKIAELEKHLGTRLLTRSTRTLVLTKEGKTFYQSCVHIIELIEQTELEVMASHDLIRGPLNIVMPVEVGNGLLGRCMKEFMKLHPHVTIHLELSNRKVDLIAEGIDLKVQVGELDESSLIARTFHYSTRILVASPEYLAEYGTPIILGDLKAPHQQIKNSSSIRTADKNVLAGLPYRFNVNTINSLLEACLDGFGITFMPEFICKEHIVSGRLVHVLPDVYSAQIPVSFVYPERKLISKRLRAFIDFTIMRFEEEITLRKVNEI
ncbi:MAG: LysR family transcriptional regulator [Photobacterium frigidiphilum]|uniref:LysR family transcriptional regulator n=1 Tax=Photobacterium frigidiphilum TaxID=264736 RepID=UPI003001734B